MGQLWACPQRSVPGNAADASTKAQPQSWETERTYCGMLWQFYCEQLPTSLVSVVEWYEFTSYAYVEDWIAIAIFHKSNAAAWLAFGVTFAARPFGGFLIGLAADQFGRRAALLASAYLMFAATVGQGLTPAVEYVGPIWMLLCRALQGFATGGQLGAFAVLLVENAPDPIVAQAGPLIGVSARVGIITAITVSIALNRVLSAQQMLRWGWRMPFLLTTGPGALILYAAHQTRESQAFEATRTDSDDGITCCMEEDMRATLADHWPTGLLCFTASFASNSVIYVLSTFLKQWFTRYCHMSAAQASGLMVAQGCVAMISMSALGVIADTYGLAKGNIGIASASLVASLPMFVSLYLYPDSSIVCIVAGVVIPGLTLAGTTINYSWAAGMFPLEVRGAAFSLYYNMGSAVGGQSPFICSLFASYPLFPAYYTAVLCSIQLLAFVTTLLLNEAHKEDPSRLQVAYIRPDPF